jgi:hypothetical protein
MNAHETNETRELTATELEEVAGGFWHILGRIAIGIGMTIIENQQHNGSGPC